MPAMLGANPTGPGAARRARIDRMTPSLPPLEAQVREWYAASARDLPWRRPGASAWDVMVSEFMLQQTPVARVLPVYDSWMRRWPTPGALADAAPGEAVREWGRLGYPRRALRLHAAAVEIDTRYDVVVPSTLEELLA